MGELRKDYILDRWVLIVPGRAKRPHDLTVTPTQSQSVCFFCPGNEELAMKEAGRVERDGHWVVRWFQNKFPALGEEGQPDIRTDNIFYTYSANYGVHDLIVETADHDRQLADLTVDELLTIFQIYKKCIEEIMLRPHIKYVQIIKNHGPAAGASINHSHSQVFALNHIPKNLREELDAFNKYQECPYCDIILKEKNSLRRCFENDAAVAFTPYASRFNYEIWFFPKQHCKNLSAFDALKDFVDLVKQALVRIKVLGAAYNLFIHYSPVDDFHFHVEICPRIQILGGFELSTDEIINQVSPEDAAAFYRGEHD